MVATTPQVLGINGGEFVAKGLERVYVEVDKYMGKAAQVPHLRPSTWLNVLTGVGTQLAAVYFRQIRPPYDLAMVAEGAHHLTKIVDYVEEYITPPGVRLTAAQLAAQAAAAAAAANYVATNKTVAALPLGTGAPQRYVITG